MLDDLALGDGAFEMRDLAGIRDCHPLETVDECLPAVADTGIVLDARVSDERRDSRPQRTLVERHVVEDRSEVLKSPVI